MFPKTSNQEKISVDVGYVNACREPEKRLLGDGKRGVQKDKRFISAYPKMADRLKWLLQKINDLRIGKSSDISESEDEGYTKMGPVFTRASCIRRRMVRFAGQTV